MTKSALVSVVTPVHNTAAYLKDCIESVLSQSYGDFEYIVVDNCSTDGSGEIADHYAALDTRVRVVRTPDLLSQVDNYNFALTQISDSGVFTKMCQADDWLYPHCLEEMVALGLENPSVGLISSYRFRGDQIDNVGLAPSERVLSGTEVARRYFLEGLYLFGSPTTVMYRSDLVRARRPFFEGGRPHEDTEVCFEILRSADFGFVHQVLSFSRLDEQSTMGALREMLPAALDRLIVTKRYGPHFLDASSYRKSEAQALDAYYRSLARRAVRGLFVSNGEEFWAYQRSALGLADEHLRMARLARAMAFSTGEAILSPLEVVRRVRRVIQRKAAAKR